jgi:hypothetical protein
MHSYLYTGSDKANAVQRLAIGTAGMQQPTLVVRFGPADAADPLTFWAGKMPGILPLNVMRVRLPGLDWPLSHTPADEVAVQTAMGLLTQIITSGPYRLVILDGIHEMVSCQLLDRAVLARLAACSSDETRVAMT